MLDFVGVKRQQQPTTAAELLTSDQVKAFTKKMIKGFKGIENIYTQHTPVVKEVIEELTRGRLKETAYPFLGSVQVRDRPAEVIVFIVGGVTYEESLSIYQLNKEILGTRVIIGGSTILNSDAWLEEVRIGSMAPVNSAGDDVHEAGPSRFV